MKNIIKIFSFFLIIIMLSACKGKDKVETNIEANINDMNEDELKNNFVDAEVADTNGITKK